MSEQKESNLISEKMIETASGVELSLKVWVFLEYLEKLQGRIEDLNERIKKNKLEIPLIEISETSEVYMKDTVFIIDGVEKRRKFRAVDVVIKGSMPKIPDYKLIALISKPEDKITEGVFINHIDKEYQYESSWETHDFKCDHCGTKRRRDDIYILNHTPTNKVMSVGKSCLEEFLPKKTLKSILQFCSDFDVLKTDIFSDSMPFDFQVKLVTVAEALAACLAFIELHGYVSQKSAEISQVGISTVEMVRALLYIDDSLMPQLVKDKHRDLAHMAYGKMSSYLEKITDYSYANNIKVAVSSQYIASNRIGYLCAFALEVCKAELIKTDFRLKNESGEKKPSFYQGQVGERITRRLVVVDKRQIESFSQFSDDGMTTVYTFADSDGNQYVAFPSNFYHEIGYEFIGKATVKAHKTYKDNQQTILNRIKIENDGLIARTLSELPEMVLKASFTKDKTESYRGYHVKGELIDDVLSQGWLIEWATMTRIFYSIQDHVDAFAKDEKSVDEKVTSGIELMNRGNTLKLIVNSHLRSSPDGKELHVEQRLSFKGADKVPKW